MIVVDANVLIYAVNGDTPHHHVASAWLAGALNGNEVVGFDWTVLQAFLRVVTNRRVFPSPLTIDEAREIVDEWVRHPNSLVVSPGDGHLGRLGGLLGDSGTAANLVTDAHLAAVALGMGAAIATFDAGFHRFPGPRWFICDRPRRPAWENAGPHAGTLWIQSPHVLPS